MEPSPSLSLSLPLNHFAAGTIGNNEEILTHLLLHLPPKSLLRFQSVSKQWLSIISSPNFRYLHSRFYPTTTTMISSSGPATDCGSLIFAHHEQGKLNFISFHQENGSPLGTIVSDLSNFNFFQGAHLEKLHHCNGLLALVFGSKHYNIKDFLVYNPSTREQRRIPRLNLMERDLCFFALNIVFDPVISHHYNLVCVWSESCLESYEFLQRYGFSIYSSETGIWKDNEVAYEGKNDYIYFMNGVLWNGNLHWISDWRDTLCFDLDKECLNLAMPSPVIHHRDVYIWYFGVSGGCLCLIEVDNPQMLLFDIFEGKKDYSEWILKYHVDLTPLSILYPSMVGEVLCPFDQDLCRFYMPCFLEDEKEQKPRLVISLPGKVILYDIKDVAAKELVEAGPSDIDHGLWNNFYDWTESYEFMETLANV